MKITESQLRTGIRKLINEASLLDFIKKAFDGKGKQVKKASSREEQIVAASYKKGYKAGATGKKAASDDKFYLKGFESGQQDEHQYGSSEFWRRSVSEVLLRRGIRKMINEQMTLDPAFPGRDLDLGSRNSSGVSDLTRQIEQEMRRLGANSRYGPYRGSAQFQKYLSTSPELQDMVQQLQQELGAISGQEVSREWVHDFIRHKLGRKFQRNG
jgi:hypothetical protein